MKRLAGGFLKIEVSRNLISSTRIRINEWIDWKVGERV